MTGALPHLDPAARFVAGLSFTCLLASVIGTTVAYLLHGRRMRGIRQREARDMRDPGGCVDVLEQPKPTSQGEPQ